MKINMYPDPKWRKWFAWYPILWHGNYYFLCWLWRLDIKYGQHKTYEISESKPSSQS